MFFKVIRIFIVSAVLFSYLPVIHMDYCPEQDHVTDAKMICGYIFHCPFVLNVGSLDSIAILPIGRLVSVTSSPSLEDHEYPIFHPPKVLYQRDLSLASNLSRG